MLSGAFRTKERKITVVFLGLIIIMIGALLFLDYSDNKKLTMQAVMAENYLKAGNYEQAAEAYTKAMSMKNVNQQLLSAGLAEAYVGMNDYDRALEVLRSCYQETHGNKVKEMIEEVTSKKSEYEYLQSASRAEIYFSNKEYDKAIAEYEKAKLIKSKEATSYKRIAQAYIEQGDYEMAREEVLEGLELTKDDNLTEILKVIEAHLAKEQYDKLTNEASEYIYQENYTEGVLKYQKAIGLLPKERVAYLGLTEAYVIQKEYTKAVLLLQSAVKLVKDEELKDLLRKAERLRKAEEERDNILSKLYHKLKESDFAAAATILAMACRNDSIVKDLPLYYSVEDMDSSKEQTMMIYDVGKVYLGGFSNEVKSGNGVFFLLESINQSQEYYYYDGEWKNDIPDGVGKTVEVSVLTDVDGVKYIGKTITEGFYTNALENGNMTKRFYTSGLETGRVKYIAQNGVPMPSPDIYNPEFPVPMEEAYIIGAIYIEDQPASEYYYVEPKTLWGVKTYMDKEQ